MTSFFVTLSRVRLSSFVYGKTRSLVSRATITVVARPNCSGRDSMMPIEAAQSKLHLRHVLQASIQVFDSDEESFEEGVEMLRAVLPDTTIIAALDLIDRDGGE
ncbi:hypothetical protein AZE42_01174 [Rhizopogon vesiculosus]|uniref:Uncharacterized protein n=1 Tax=Rhizopogon vesiculosus TaxID=180088 RepID=A0A1J8QGZ6_9AGAM|nr:hypothetical protein AZE42_01174 [Rhizopogon vesiculosus]